MARALVGTDNDPSPEEVAKYAEQLGVDLEQDSDFLSFVKYSLKLPVPHPWEIRHSGGAPLYFNVKTHETSWERPCDLDKTAYHAAKAHRDAPVRVVTIHASLERASDTVIVRVCGSIHGEELVVLELEPTVQLGVVRSKVAQQLKMFRRLLRIVTFDGTVNMRPP